MRNSRGIKHFCPIILVCALVLSILPSHGALASDDIWTVENVEETVYSSIGKAEFFRST